MQPSICFKQKENGHFLAFKSNGPRHYANNSSNLKISLDRLVFFRYLIDQTKLNIRNINPTNKIMKSISPKLAALACLSCLVPVAAHAGVLAQDTFSYGTDVSLAGQNGGTGWSGGWSITGGNKEVSDNYDLSGAAPTGYTYPIAPNAVYIQGNGTNTAAIYRSLASPIDLASNSTVYFSYAFARVDSSQGGGSEFIELSLRSGSTALVNMGFDSAEKITIKDARPNGASSTNTNVGYSFTNDFSTTPKYLVVGKVVTSANGTDSFYMSLYSASDNISSEPTTWDVELTGQEFDETVDTLYLVAGRYTENVYIDNLTLADSYGSAIAIPESNSWALFLGAMSISTLLGLRYRRRR